MRRAERVAGLSLTHEQRLAVAVLLRQHVGLLQGGAGVGKTTTVKVLVAAWRARGGHVEMAALSGKAALRLSRSVGEEARTIARLIGGLDRRAELVDSGRLIEAPDGDRWAESRKRRRAPGAAGDEPFPPKLTPGTMLVLDEASMVDLGSLHDLARRMPDGSRLILVGDHAQLPPVGLGQCYHDLVEAGRGVAVLTRVLRQAEGNPLLDVALAIREGREPDLPAFTGTAPGVQLVDCQLADVAARLRATRDRLRRETPGGEVLLLGGLQSTVKAINWAEVARRQSEGAQGVRLGPLCPWVSVGDPVIMCRNHYKFGLMNGEMGVLTGLDPVEVAWGTDGSARALEDECRADVQLAWAITGHRSQGSEAPRVVVALDSEAMLTRHWLYTAVTRAAEQAVLVGPREMMARAVRRANRRVTGFSLIAGGAGSLPVAESAHT